MTPIEELKERFEKVWEEDDGIPGGEHCTCVDLKEITEDFKRLAECYREIAAKLHTTKNLYIENGVEKWAIFKTPRAEEIVDKEASELFQGKIK